MRRLTQPSATLLIIALKGDAGVSGWAALGAGVGSSREECFQQYYANLKEVLRNV